MVSGCPSLIQVTVVAGEPVEIQVRVDDMHPWVNPRCVILGGSGEGTTYSFNILQPRVARHNFLVTKRGLAYGNKESILLGDCSTAMCTKNVRKEIPVQYSQLCGMRYTAKNNIADTLSFHHLYSEIRPHSFI